MTRATAVIIAASVLAGAAEAEAQKMRLGEVLVLAPSEAPPASTGGGRVFQADRGGRKGQYLLVTASGATSQSKPPAGRASEYHLLSPSTVGSLPELDVLGIHYLKVRPDRAASFEQFVGRTLHPAVGNLRPDLRLLYYKATAGPEAGSYILLMALTRESRDKYWPGGADSDELRAVFKPVQPLTKELGTYFVEGSALMDPKFAAAVFESREWADFVVVP